MISVIARISGQVLQSHSSIKHTSSSSQKFSVSENQFTCSCMVVFATFIQVGFMKTTAAVVKINGNSLSQVS
jgi:hypothetical protein